MPKIALVTGATKGLGLAFAKHLSCKGYVPVLHYNKDLPAAKRAATLFPHTMIVQGDLTKKKNCEKVIKTVITKYNRIDLLINNIGSFVFEPVDKWSEKEFRNVIESNLHSTFFMMQSALKVMKEGYIVNIGCAGCERIVVRENTTPYYIAKSGVAALTKHFSTLHKKIKVNALLPGVLETSKFVPKDVKKKQIVPLREMCDALDVILKSGKTGQFIEVSRGWKPKQI